MVALLLRELRELDFIPAASKSSINKEIGGRELVWGDEGSMGGRVKSASETPVEMNDGGGGAGRGFSRAFSSRRCISCDKASCYNRLDQNKLE